MNKIKVIIVIILAIIVCGAGFILGQSFNKPKEVTKREDNKIINTKTIFWGETIKSGLKNMGKLQTAEYYYTHVEHLESSREIFDIEIPLTGAQYIYSYDGVVTAGIDFEKIDVEVDKTNKNIKIELPDVERLSSEIDTNTFKIYDEKNNIFNPISPSDVSASVDNLKKDEEKKAVEKGLYKKAEANAKVIIENFVKGFIPEDYEVNIK